LLATGVIALVLCLAAVAVTRVTTSYLVDQVDAQLVRFTGREVGAPPTSSPPIANVAPPAGRPSGALSTLYVGTFKGSHLQTTLLPVSGATSDAVPSISHADAQTLAAHKGVKTVAATDGSVRFRVTARTTDNGDLVVFAVQLGDVDAAIRRLVTVLVIAGAVAFAALGLITWWVIRLGVNPIQRMTAAASRVAAGDLSTRIQHAPRGTEAADLGDALNQMLERIEGALSERVESERRVRRFLADASHELRTPVATIRGYAELVRTAAITDRAELEVAMARMEAESVRLSRLVADMTALARLERVESRRPGVVQLDRVAEDAVSDLRVRVPDRVVRTRLDEVNVMGDVDELHQVLANVIDNASRHTAPGTPIDITLDAVGDRAVFAVIDHGEGVDAQTAQRAFERFYRADPSRNSDSGGSGLGLAIVAAIVEAHGGTVRMEARPDGAPDGRGTTVVIALPVEPARPAERLLSGY
jgi:two-component system OmpR family sensor kinase